MPGEGRVRLSLHVVEKLGDQTSQRLGITSQRIEAVLHQPACIDNSDFPVLMAVGALTTTLSLCVVYKFVGGEVRVITFFPAKRGRYESKILS